MKATFTFSEFLTKFPDDAVCLEEVKKLKYPQGVYCVICRSITKHYKLQGRTAYSCKYCRNQVFPLAGTIFERTTTSLRVWFYALFLMTHTRAGISIKTLQRELDVTYKTAWRIYTQVRILMARNNGDLLSDREENVRRWVLFNKIEITVAQKQEPQ